MTIAFGRSILILAPHPDDEVVGVCAAIGRAQAEGARIAVIFLTHGCVDRSTMWPWARSRYPEAIGTRRAEAEQVAAHLGLDVVGWSDERAARHLWRELAAAEVQVRAAIAAHGIDQVWTPAFEGGNPDHDGASAIASRLASEGLSVLEFAEYNLAGGQVCSHAFPAPSGDEEKLALTEAEQAKKRRALKLYASEGGNLGYVACEAEVLRPLQPYEYARAPHPGKLWYARFQWVPFRHPQVDFTKPADVYDHIAAYLADSPASALATS